MSTARVDHMGRILVEVEVVNHQDVIRASDGTLAPEKIRRFQLQAVADTGSTHLSLPEDVVKRLGLPTIGNSTITYADRRKVARDVVEDAQVELLGRRGTFRAVVEPDRTTALLGAIVLEDLDLLIDCRSQTLQPRDPQGISIECE